MYLFIEIEINNANCILKVCGFWDCDFELQTATEALLETFDISKLDYLIQQNLHNGNIKGLQHRVTEILGLEYHSLW